MWYISLQTLTLEDKSGFECEVIYLLLRWVADFWTPNKVAIYIPHVSKVYFECE